MRGKIMTSKTLRVSALAAFLMTASAWAAVDGGRPATGWQSPPEDVLKVLHAPQLPRAWTAPTGDYLLLADPVLYPPLAELAGPMHKLAGMRVNPATNGYHGRRGGTSARLVRVEDGATTPLGLPEGAEVHGVDWTVDGRRFALTVGHPDRIGLWVGSVEGEVVEIEGLALNPLLGSAVSWLPDQERLLVRRIPERGAPPEPLSFQLLLPPGYEEGTRLPTVLYAYPLEYSGAATAGQVRGSAQRFMRLYGASHLYFLLRGYAVLDQTAMPMLGDPETTYDTFVPQLVADAEAAVAKAVEMGVADPERIGVIGHSHGGLMVANLLAHTDLFRAGIARSGSYNKTNQPFGFQAERRSLFEARDAYIELSPTFFAHRVDEPVLIIHGDDDSNPGTLTYQSEVFFEAVRGSGGTARLVLLPFEDHGYRARESVEHVLWEQLRWFDEHVKGAGPAPAQASDAQ